MDYRKQIDRYDLEMVSEDDFSGSDNLCVFEDISNIFDDVESRVKNIADSINMDSSLQEIKDELEKLASDLY